MKELYFFSFANFNSFSANALNTKLLHKAFCKTNTYEGKIIYKKLIFINDRFSSIFLKKNESFLIFPIPQKVKIRYLIWIFYSFFYLLSLKNKSFFSNVKVSIHTRDLVVANLCEFFKLNYSIEYHRFFVQEIKFLYKVSKKKCSSLNHIFALTAP